MTPRAVSRHGFTLYELLVVLGMGTVVFAMLLPAIGKARLDAVRRQSANNLKQIGIGLNGIATRTEGLLPPSVGTFYPDLPSATIFFHILPDIEQRAVYSRYAKEPDKVPDTVTIKTYLSLFDPSCVKENTALTSYASNANVFGLENGGSTRYPAAFNTKGTSNSVIFVERYARTGTKSKHYWYDRGPTRTYVYPPAKGAEPWTSILDPQFGVTFDSTEPAVIDDTAHALMGNSLWVGLMDGSARSVTPAVTKTFKAEKVKPDPSIWQWACSINGTLSNQPPPAGW